MSVMTNATVWLMRHATAREKAPGQSDFDRPLAREGVAEAGAIGQWYANEIPAQLRIIASPALRVRMTFEGLAQWCLGIAMPAWEPSLYLAELPGLVDQLVMHGEQTLLLLGHNPGFEALFQHLVANVPREIHSAGLMPPAAIYRIDYVRLADGVRARSGRIVHHTRPAWLDAPRNG